MKKTKQKRACWERKAEEKKEEASRDKTTGWCERGPRRPLDHAGTARERRGQCQFKCSISVLLNFPIDGSHGTSMRAREKILADLDSRQVLTPLRKGPANGKPAICPILKVLKSWTRPETPENYSRPITKLPQQRCEQQSTGELQSTGNWSYSNLIRIHVSTYFLGSVWDCKDEHTFQCD